MRAHLGTFGMAARSSSASLSKRSAASRSLIRCAALASRSSCAARLRKQRRSIDVTPEAAQAFNSFFGFDMGIDVAFFSANQRDMTVQMNCLELRRAA